MDGGQWVIVDVGDASLRLATHRNLLHVLLISNPRAEVYEGVNSSRRQVIDPPGNLDRGAASVLSWASMKRRSSSRSRAVGAVEGVQSTGRLGRWARNVARARFRALLADSTLLSSCEAVSLADQPRTSRSITKGNHRHPINHQL